jgi:hypothetical protein
LQQSGRLPVQPPARHAMRVPGSEHRVDRRIGLLLFLAEQLADSGEESFEQIHGLPFR